MDTTECHQIPPTRQEVQYSTFPSPKDQSREHGTAMQTGERSQRTTGSRKSSFPTVESNPAKSPNLVPHVVHDIKCPSFPSPHHCFFMSHKIFNRGPSTQSTDPQPPPNAPSHAASCWQDRCPKRPHRHRLGPFLFSWLVDVCPRAGCGPQLSSCCSGLESGGHKMRRAGQGNPRARRSTTLDPALWLRARGQASQASPLTLSSRWNFHYALPIVPIHEALRPEMAIASAAQGNVPFLTALLSLSIWTIFDGGTPMK